MEAESNSYAIVVAMLAIGVVFPLIPLLLARLWAGFYSPAKPGLQKNATYECGLESKGDAWIQFRSDFYIYAMVFLVFDVEAIFLVPFAVSFTDLSLGACLAMVVFILLMVEGLVWAWRKGVLVWR